MEFNILRHQSQKDGVVVVVMAVVVVVLVVVVVVAFLLDLVLYIYSLLKTKQTDRQLSLVGRPPAR